MMFLRSRRCGFASAGFGGLLALSPIFSARLAAGGAWGFRSWGCLSGGAWVVPGVALRFGGLSCLGGVLAFLWSLCLLVGCGPGLVAWIISLVRSVAADLGTELGFIGRPDVLNAFLVQVAGGDLRTAIASIDPQSRLFRRALRIGGWSHMWGNLMKMACFQIPNWPKVVALIRSCCRFMFMYVYRQCMILIPNANCF